MKKLLSENELENEYGIPVPKLQRDRLLGRGIPYYKVGRLVRYRREEIEAWLTMQRRGGDPIPSVTIRTAQVA